MSVDPFPLAAKAALWLIGVSLLLASLRLVRGPTTPDRVVALDLVAVLTVGMIAIHAVARGVHALLQPAAVLAVVAFIGTIAFAGSLEREGS